MNEKEIDISVNIQSENNRPMDKVSFEKGLLEIIGMAEDLDVNSEHDKLFVDIKSVVSNYFTKKEE